MVCIKYTEMKNRNAEVVSELDREGELRKKFKIILIEVQYAD